MLQDNRVIKKAKDVVKPVSYDGYEKVEFEENKDKKSEINKEDLEI